VLLPLVDIAWVAIAELFFVILCLSCLYVLFYTYTYGQKYRSWCLLTNLLSYRTGRGCLRVGGLAAGSTATTLVDLLDAGWSSCAHPRLLALVLPT
jgi:hypothetical protein